jgi:thiol-disulfide isomerase/thioredoxin
MLEITNYMDKIALNPKAFVYFTASWCQPCKMFKPHFSKLGLEDPRPFYIVDVDRLDDETLKKYNIMSVPQIHILEDGESVGTITSRTYLEMKAEIA